MYEHEGLRDMFFIMLYGGAAMMALLAAVYLWLRNGNAVSRDMESPKDLRHWDRMNDYREIEINLVKLLVIEYVIW